MKPFMWESGCSYTFSKPMDWERVASQVDVDFCNEHRNLMWTDHESKLIKRASALRQLQQFECYAIVQGQTKLPGTSYPLPWGFLATDYGPVLLTCTRRCTCEQVCEHLRMFLPKNVKIILLCEFLEHLKRWSFLICLDTECIRKVKDSQILF